MKKMLLAIIGTIYTWVLRPVFFLSDPEDVHDRTTIFGEFLGSNSLTRRIAGFFLNYFDKSLSQNIKGINFINPIGLAAGFDKDAHLTGILPSVGFGFEEIGSVTGEKCAGNPRPRLWRLKKSRSLIVYYGLKNDGAEVVSNRLFCKKFKFPIGISIAKTNDPSTVGTEAGIKDYVKAYKIFNSKNIGDYFTINISCPNAFGGQPFSDPNKLDLLLQAIIGAGKTKPIFLKMPPDLSPKEIDEIISLADKYKIDGFICTNLTKDRGNLLIKNKIKDELPTANGGLSGKVVEELADKMISYIYQKTGKRFVIIGCGGIFSAEDAYRKIRLGASLLQLITGMIYQGPQLISQINIGLSQFLKRDGFKNVGEAVGYDIIHRQF